MKFSIMRARNFLRFILAVGVLGIWGRGWGVEATVGEEHRTVETAGELIKKGNEHYDKLQPAEALKFYLPAEKLEPKNVKLLVKIARQYRHLMSEANRPEEKLRLGKVALGYALRAVEIDGNDGDAQLGLAISYGKLLPLQGSRDQFYNSRLVKSAVDKAIAIDPGSDLAWHVLGRWYLNVAEIGSVKRALAQVAFGKIPEVKYEDAERCFLKAIDLNPRRLMHYIELGRTYAAMGRNAEAKKMIRKGLEMAETETDDPETKALGRQILKKLP